MQIVRIQNAPVQRKQALQKSPSFTGDVYQIIYDGENVSYSFKLAAPTRTQWIDAVNKYQSKFPGVETSNFRDLSDKISVFGIRFPKKHHEAESGYRLGVSLKEGEFRETRQIARIVQQIPEAQAKNWGIVRFPKIITILNDTPTTTLEKAVEQVAERFAKRLKILSKVK